ncbi:hypothetical protein OROGR_000861 [Orobanche gracilis]
MYFKGVSVAGFGDSSDLRISGIGVVMEKSGNDPPLRVQKKLDFYVEELVADYLALLDGLSVSIQNNISRVFAFTDCEALHNQRCILAQVAVGIVSSPHEGKDLTEICAICCKEKLSSMMLKLKCFHKFCSHCMKTYIEGKVQSAQIPIRCPQLDCKYRISASECRMSSSSRSDGGFVECPVCARFICVECEVPWHSSMTCQEYKNLALDEKDGSDLTLDRLAQNKRCGHELCYSCGAEYDDGQQTSRCAFLDEDYSEERELATTYPTQQLEQWAWDSFESLPTMDTYSDQERSQLTLFQRFLAGGFSLTDLHPYQSPPRYTDSYADAMKDLHQLPWLERFVSVISDDYYEDSIL